MQMNVGQKIKEARKRAGLSQAELTDLCGWEHQSRVSGYETGKREPNMEDLQLIAKAVGLETVPNLLRGDVQDNQSGYQITTRKVPLISWQHLGTWCESHDAFEPGDADEWLDCPFEFSESAFCLRVDGDAMFGESGYRDGEVILVDPKVPAVHNDDVVALAPSGKYTFRRLQITNDGTYLLALNPDQPNRKIQIPENTHICGVVTASWTKRR